MLGPRSIISACSSPPFDRPAILRARPCRKAEEEEEECVWKRRRRTSWKEEEEEVVEEEEEVEDDDDDDMEEKLGECWEEDIGRTNEPAQALMNINPAEPAKNTRTERTLLQCLLSINPRSAS
ncbi:hypothetical protein HZH68_014485 [Vespula germanica]|uniref:Uncharacterized protein n=1 Tax=Vespula germanica TaxID=30212 RepID=A0A834J879_VESGE|nr:hypothetical protein HZH68_014485 [Vespula germanica]